MTAEPLVLPQQSAPIVPDIAVESPASVRLEAVPAPRALTVEELTPPYEAAWDRFVRTKPDGTFFHQLDWRWLVERTFGHRPHYLMARRGETITGVLPMFELKSLLFGHSLVSIPFAIGGGVVAADDETARSLLFRAQELADRLDVDYLELRSERPASDHLLTKDLYVTFRSDLTQGEDAWLQRMDRKRRQMMNYVLKDKAGFSFSIAGLEELPLFYRLFSESMRHHGTPVYPRLFLEQILDRFPTRTNLFFVHHAGKPVAGVLNLLFGDVIMPFYAGADRSVRPRGVDDYMYLSIWRWGRDHGFKTFDFGRSKRGTGAYEFKARWGMDEVPLAYQYHLVRAKQLPNVSPANPKYQAAIEMWRKLPLPVTQFLGPRIIRRIP
ncbi:MAG TPA: FemAB family XrtA/PEP-CTERM system-associated protein [Thermoanaerobaculia bacterium]|nr:FemAB family XrtA/PEP-CTERM system-associated protein [Thermoanaerobaculia bacterium]